MSWQDILKTEILNWLKQNTDSNIEDGHIKMIEGAIEAKEMIRLRKLSDTKGTSTNGFFIEFNTKIPILTDDPDEMINELVKKIGTSTYVER